MPNKKNETKKPETKPNKREKKNMNFFCLTPPWHGTCPRVLLTYPVILHQIKLICPLPAFVNCKEILGQGWDLYLLPSFSAETLSDLNLCKSSVWCPCFCGLVSISVLFVSRRPRFLKVIHHLCFLQIFCLLFSSLSRCCPLR